MVKNEYENVELDQYSFKKPNPMSTFMPIPSQNNQKNKKLSNKIKMSTNDTITESRVMETFNKEYKSQIDIFKGNQSQLSSKQKSQINSLSSSTKSNKSALSGLSSFTNSSSYRSNDGAIVVIEVGVDDVGIDVGTINDQLILGSTSSSTSPSSLSSSSSPSSSNSNSLSSKNSKKMESSKFTILNCESDVNDQGPNYIIPSDICGSDLNQIDSNSISFFINSQEERGIDCPEYFVPEIKQKPCYPPSLLQQQGNPLSQINVQENEMNSDNKKSSKSLKTSSKNNKKKSESKEKSPDNAQSVKNSHEGLELFENSNKAQYEAEMIQKINLNVPEEISVVDNTCHTLGTSLLQYIDEDSKSKLLSKSKDDSANDNTNVNENSSNSDLNFQKNFNFSFEAAGKVDYTEFMFDSPVEKNHKSQPKLSLDTFEKVVNGLNDLKPTKISLGKKLFEKQQLKDENELLFDKNNLSSDKSEDTLLFDKEFSASIFTNQNSTRNSDKRISPKQMRKAKDCYDEKPIVPFNSNSNEKVNHAFTMDNDQYIINKEDPKSLNLHNKTRIQDTKSCQSLTRPPTPPPRSDKQILSCFNHDESNNYNLNNSDQIDKTSYIEKISSKNLFAISDSNKFELTTNSGQLLLDKNHQTAVNNESQEIMEIFEQINMIQTKLESTKVKKGDEENCMESAEDDSHEMNLINNLYEAQDCKNTLDLYNKIINLSKTRSLKPTHVNCFGLVHEIMDMVARMSSKNLISKSDVNDDLSINERGIDVMSNSFGSNQVNSETTDELCMLLSKLDMKNLLLTHDQIADRCEAEVLERQKINKSLMNEQELHYSSENENTLKDLEDNFQNYDSKQSLDKLNYERASDKLDLENQNNRLSPELSEEGKYLMQKAAHYSVENLKLVNIEKSETPLGATIKNQDGNIVIGRIVNGGAADKSGLLHEEDEILEINNVPVRGKTINDICDMLFNIKGIVSFLIIPNMDYEPVKVDEVDCKKMEAISDQNILHIRALYNYVPLEDIYIPCKELGLGFNKGDILHVISQDDEDWWQAYVDDDKDQSLAGLIPSQSFQERRCSQMQAFIGDSFMNRKKRQTGFCMKAIGKNRRRRMFDSFNDTFSGEILTYERVVLYKPLPTKKRPIVLIGPHSIGRHELRKKLMQTNPSMFEVAIPHTTRSARREEIEGKDYHFLQRHIFEADIKQGRFIEYGEYEKNLYGTSYEAIKRVIENARICVLNLYPQALKTLRDSDLMPYIIYIGPSNLAKLKELKLKMNENYRENDLLDIIDKGREIEETYGHYFDKIIRNADMEKTFHELFETIQQVQNEENWVPMKWLKNLK